MHSDRSCRIHPRPGVGGGGSLTALPTRGFCFDSRLLVDEFLDNGHGVILVLHCILHLIEDGGVSCDKQERSQTITVTAVYIKIVLPRLSNKSAKSDAFLIAMKSKQTYI